MWLPKIATHEVTFAVGYSEPDSGTDLASLTTRAELDGDEWVVNGTKLWNSGAHHATHEWMLVRTSPELPLHSGLSLIIVPLDADGVEYEAIKTWGEVHTNQAFFVDVRVPKHRPIGEVNRGWEYIAAALDFRRTQIGARTIVLGRFLDEVRGYCLTTIVDGTLPIERAEIRHRLAKLIAIRLSDTPWRITGALPAIGEHTLEVLRDVAGLEQAETDALLAAGESANSGYPNRTLAGRRRRAYGCQVNR